MEKRAVVRVLLTFVVVSLMCVVFVLQASLAHADSSPSPDFTPSGSDGQSAQMQFVKNTLSPLQSALGSDNFYNLVGDVLSAHDIHACAEDLLTWGESELAVLPTNTPDDCAGVWDDAQSIMASLQPQPVY